MSFSLPDLTQIIKDEGNIAKINNLKDLLILKPGKGHRIVLSKTIIVFIQIPKS